MKILIIGFGRIGQAVTKLLKTFEVEIIVCDPGLNKDETSYPLLNLNQALALADIIDIHSSGGNRLLGRREFALMKQGVYILNAARGELIDEKALIDALDSGQIAGAWLDTFISEPYDGPLANYEQVILTPHVGSYTYEGRLKMEMDAVDNLILGFQE